MRRAAQGSARVPRRGNRRRLRTGRLDRLGHPHTILCLGNGPSSEAEALRQYTHEALFRVNHSWLRRPAFNQPQVVFTGGGPTIGTMTINPTTGKNIEPFKNWGPRISATYDLSGNGHTVLRGAFGIYRDQPLVGIFEQNSFTMPPIVNNVTFTNATTTTLAFSGTFLPFW